MANKFGLGKGLADIKAEMGIVPDISVLTGNFDRIIIKQIPLKEIKIDLEQPRKNFKKEELKDLADSIKEKGVLQPILLRPINDETYNFMIVAGERRFRASEMLGLKTIPALIKNIEYKDSLEIALIENVQRENLNPIEEAEGYKKLIEKFNYKFSDISRLIGKSESYIRNLLRLDVLPDKVKKMIIEGKITASHARTISVVENPEVLAERIISDNISVSDLEGIVKKYKRSEKSRIFNNNFLSEDSLKEIKALFKKIFDLDILMKEKKGGAVQISFDLSNRIKLNDFVEKLKNI